MYGLKQVIIYVKMLNLILFMKRAIQSDFDNYYMHLKTWLIY